ncbi:MAG TPA: hypothetical protein VFQ65_27940, partial [Kofleriaceae bacterium]|nr:hypothetical protein [Kofleriaceae bacterium]
MRNLGVVVLALWMFGCGGKHKPGDLKVTGSPTGQVDGEVRMVFAFSRPMVKKDHLGVAASAPIVLTPALAHEARWSDDKTLVVVPTASLPLSTKFTAVVPGETKALDGSELGVDTSFEFFTERLTGTAEVVGSKARAAKDQLVKLTFSQQVTFDEVAAQCSFIAKSGEQKVKLAPKTSPGPGKMYAVVPAGELALDTDWTLRCKAGLKGVVGNLGLEAAAEEKFHTYGPLRFVDMDPKGNDIVPDEKLRLQIELTNPLAEPFKLSITPPVAGFPQGCHALADAPAGVSCSGQFEAQTKYTLTIDAAQTDVFGQKLGKPQVIEFRTTDAKPTISLESGYFVGELKRPVVPLWTRNVTELDVTAVAITQANFHELSPLLDWWGPKVIDFSKTKLLKPVVK